MNAETHMAAMSSDEPRGYGVRGDVRKRLEVQRLPHPDPAVCELMARAWDEGWNASANYMSYNYDSHAVVPNPYRSQP